MAGPMYLLLLRGDYFLHQLRDPAGVQHLQHMWERVRRCKLSLVLQALYAHAWLVSAKLVLAVAFPSCCEDGG